ncbi:MAG: 6-bladed beta-propeller [Nitrospirota bacterium]|nr:6-bladed beta-propeller [Nitrospirota bacterium]
MRAPAAIRLRPVAALLMLGMLSACASTPSVPLVLAPDMERVWPLPPDAARVAWLHQVREPADVGVAEPGRRFFKGLAGKQTPPRIESPVGLYADEDGWLLVADTGLQVVHIFNLKAPSYAQAFQLPEGRLASPVGVTLDREGGRIFVSDSIQNRIFLYRTDGYLIGWMGEGLNRVAGLAWDAQRGHLIAADTGNHRVLVFDRDGVQIKEIGHRGDQPGEFNFPTHVAVDGAGNIYVSDSLNFRVQVFGPEGDLQRGVGRAGQTVGSFSKPKGVAVDKNGTLFVVDGIYDVVQMFDASGQVLMHFGSAGSKPGHFWLPAGIAVAGEDIYVADTQNQRVQLFRMLPAPLGDGT